MRVGKESFAAMPRSPLARGAKRHGLHIIPQPMQLAHLKRTHHHANTTHPYYPRSSREAAPTNLQPHYLLSFQCSNTAILVRSNSWRKRTSSFALSSLFSRVSCVVTMMASNHLRPESLLRHLTSRKPPVLRHRPLPFIVSQIPDTTMSHLTSDADPPSTLSRPEKVGATASEPQRHGLYLLLRNVTARQAQSPSPLSPSTNSIQASLAFPQPHHPYSVVLRRSKGWDWVPAQHLAGQHPRTTAMRQARGYLPSPWHPPTLTCLPCPADRRWIDWWRLADASLGCSEPSMATPSVMLLHCQTLRQMWKATTLWPERLCW